MKWKLIVTIGLTLTCFSTSAQTIELRFGRQMSLVREIHGAQGLGFQWRYSNDTSMIFSAGFNLEAYWNQRSFDDCTGCTTSEIVSSFSSRYVGVFGVWRVFEAGSFVISTGPSVHYSSSDLSQRGRIANWIRASEFKSIGLGILLECRYQSIFGERTDVNLTIAPTYDFLLGKRPDTSGIVSSIEKSFDRTSVQLGLSRRF